MDWLIMQQRASHFSVHICIADAFKNRSTDLNGLSRKYYLTWLDLAPQNGTAHLMRIAAYVHSLSVCFEGSVALVGASLSTSTYKYRYH